jgi:hypothetical protein
MSHHTAPPFLNRPPGVAVLPMYTVRAGHAGGMKASDHACHYVSEKFEKTSVSRASGVSNGALEVDWSADGYRRPTEAE